MHLYDDLADWWPLISPPEDYAEEAAEYAGLLRGAGAVRTVLELGSGGGNNASFLKKHFEMTLVDLSPRMIEVSRRLNPELRHFVGDMRTFHLDEIFDAVFVHDAVQYMTTRVDLHAAMTTVAAHLRPGGVAVIAPDATLETLEEGTSIESHDGDGRRVRYLEWTLPPEPGMTVHEVHYAFLLRDRDGSMRHVHDVHREGVFPRSTWVEVLRNAGLDARLESREIEGDSYDTLVATRRG